MEPSMTSTNGSNSSRSALWNQSMKLSLPCSGPHSKSINGQCSAILGRPGRARRAISSILGWVAAVNATDSPPQDKPQLIQSTWIELSPSCGERVALGVSLAMALYLTSGDQSVSLVAIVLAEG